ncbi:MAG TPA: hypothetical protein VEW94_11960, partial [Chloroflexia bacterium]|nr:hypothetical protein [Chloroflexia bacterium]
APPSGMYYGVSLDIAPSGNMFVAWVDFTPANNNVTWVQVRKYAPNNTTVLGEWRITPTATFKIDNVSISHRGANLLVAMGTHTSVAGPARTRAVELATIPNVYS